MPPLVGYWVGGFGRKERERENMCCGQHSDKGAKTLSDKYVQQRAVVPCVSAKSGRTVSVGKYGEYRECVSTRSIRVRLEENLNEKVQLLEITDGNGW